MLPRSLLFSLLAPLTAFASSLPIDISTNAWTLESVDTIETVSFVLAQDITVNGRTLDDSFWLAQDTVELNGKFGNDVWALGMNVKLNGTFADHARIAAQSVTVNGIVSNGLWAVAATISASTNTHLYGDQFLYSDQLSLLGHIEGNIYAKARTITLGGTIIGDVRLVGDDIVIRPGTTILGNLHYITTNQSIVLDSNSQVSGDLYHMPAPASISTTNPAATWLLTLYFFGAAILVGIPMMILFPNYTGLAVRCLRISLWKCGLAGIAATFGAPFIIVAIAVTVIGLPLAAVTGALYGLVMYLGKIAVALAIGSTLLHKRGQISLSGALLSLVTGLFLYYSLAFIPFVGSSLQATATAFGAGALIVAALTGRGRVGQNVSDKEKDQTA
jgi:hypothetical protein